MADPYPHAETDDRPGSGGDSGAGGPLVLTPAQRVDPAAQGASPASGLTDTDALRSLVRGILEEELRGDFGARITRGTRRLVRAEVALLLRARDPE